MSCINALKLKKWGVVLTLLMGLKAVAQHGAPKEVGMTSSEVARELRGVNIEEHLGQKVNLELEFKDERGQTVKLKDFFDGKTPIVLSLVYFGCPGLCNFHLNGVIESIKGMDWKIGDQFKYLVISFDPKEDSDLAASKKETYLKLYKHPGAEKGWHFLTGSQASISELTQQVGFRYEWKEDTQEWAHASALMMLTPQGEIARYLHGIMFDSKTFKLALMESTDGKIGNIVDQMVWYCFHYDPKQSKYTLMASRVMQIGGVLIIVIMGFLLIPFWMRTKKEVISS